MALVREGPDTYKTQETPLQNAARKNKGSRVKKRTFFSSVGIISPPREGDKVGAMKSRFQENNHLRRGDIDRFWIDDLLDGRLSKIAPSV